MSILSVMGTEPTAVHWYLVLGTLLGIAGTVRLMLTRDLMARLVAMNVVGVGSLLILLAVAAIAPEAGTGAGAQTGTQTGTQAGAESDAVLSALVITGLVITVAFTGVGAVLIRRIESTEADGEQ
ncbi:NADH-quinone oxidoreductase subunit K [Nesterenkonia aerolata]|uniref:NADH-quinone oxidoreductase subunit K n=1 Tax=Nesterenkonia aerolata TaxID=3074079 RepID=A0ABU2DS65_9MICC|nr:NADH-quinone oxidoreductase subunit K [Nesterenkonia sp. LY-0111]MDR8019353.1 NADH-quinone oxidoreductase subunit K [Nesterenkonia sp. LY-0111]